MTPQERDLITTLLTRLKSTAGQTKDGEAEALIRQAMVEQPDAPYYLVQTVLIQDLSLHNAQNRIAELEQQVAQVQAKPASGGFLGGLFGRTAPPAPPPSSVPSAGPWTRSPQVAASPPPAYGQPQYGPQGYGPAAGAGGVMGSMGAGGGGFLRQAAATAAGVAGGALLFEGISSLFGHQAGAGIMGGQPMMPGLGETVVNNYYGTDSGNQDFSGGQGSGNQDNASSGGYDPSADQDFSGGQDQSYDSGQDFSGGDSGGGDDFSGGGDVSSC
jgi:uncharacterized protein